MGSKVCCLLSRVSLSRPNLKLSAGDPLAPRPGRQHTYKILKCAIPWGGARKVSKRLISAARALPFGAVRSKEAAEVSLAAAAGCWALSSTQDRYRSLGRGISGGAAKRTMRRGKSQKKNCLKDKAGSARRPPKRPRNERFLYGGPQIGPEIWTPLLRSPRPKVRPRVKGRSKHPWLPRPSPWACEGQALARFSV